jgi:hypothetical protein
MLLTDPAVQYWSCVIAILTTLAVLLLWNRVRGPRAVKGLARLGLLVGGYLATAVAVLVSVNIAYGGLIVSVSDLFADLNPPMGQFGHHMHGPCGLGTGTAAPGGAAYVVPGEVASGAAVAPVVPSGMPCPMYLGPSHSAKPTTPAKPAAPPAPPIPPAAQPRAGSAAYALPAQVRP